LRRKALQRSVSPKQRRQLRAKVLTVFGDDIKKLPKELQRILADDLVTAFVNRMTVFVRIQPKKGLYTATKRSLNP